ncbi:MAG TPA: hypothetical protein VG164_02620 [Trebonia sp.]|nr:hypothetical protein [Trebonia sp.]
MMTTASAGSRSLPDFDAGQSGQAEQTLNRVAPAQNQSAAETVLIQARAGGVTFAIPGNVGNEYGAVLADERAVAAVQRRRRSRSR